MAPREVITVGSKTFKLKKDATEHFRKIRDAAVVDEFFDASDERHAEVHDLFMRHPTYPKDGIAGFCVTVEQRYQTRCFQVRYEDGALINFSLGTCVSGKEPTWMFMLVAACRCTAQFQIDAYRRSRGSRYRCDVCNVSGGKELLEVDHVIPFCVLLEQYLGQCRCYTPKKFAKNPTNGVVDFLGEDAFFKNGWIDFHANAKLQLVCKKCHDAKTYKQNIGG